MESLRGPLARSNRANLNHNREDGTRDRAPVELRYPHNSKKWGLGVGQVPGERALEGVFAIGKMAKADGVIFTAGQLICPFEGTNKVNGQPILLIMHGLTMAYRKVVKDAYTLMHITTRTARYAG